MRSNYLDGSGGTYYKSMSASYGSKDIFHRSHAQPPSLHSDARYSQYSIVDSGSRSRSGIGGGAKKEFSRGARGEGTADFHSTYLRSR